MEKVPPGVGLKLTGNWEAKADELWVYQGAGLLGYVAVGAAALGGGLAGLFVAGPAGAVGGAAGAGGVVADLIPEEDGRASITAPANAVITVRDETYTSWVGGSFKEHVATVEREILPGNTLIVSASGINHKLTGWASRPATGMDKAGAWWNDWGWLVIGAVALAVAAGAIYAITRARARTPAPPSPVTPGGGPSPPAPAPEPGLASKAMDVARAATERAADVARTAVAKVKGGG